MPNLFTHFVPTLRLCKKELLNTGHFPPANIINCQKNNIPEWIALILLTTFFGCLGVASAGFPKMWSLSKVFFLVGFLLFIIGNRMKRQNLTSKKLRADQQSGQKETEPDVT